MFDKFSQSSDLKIINKGTNLIIGISRDKLLVTADNIVIETMSESLSFNLTDFQMGINFNVVLGHFKPVLLNFEDLDVDIKSNVSALPPEDNLLTDFYTVIPNLVRGPLKPFVNFLNDFPPILIQKLKFRDYILTELTLETFHDGRVNQGSLIRGGFVFSGLQYDYEISFSSNDSAVNSPHQEVAVAISSQKETNINLNTKRVTLEKLLINFSSQSEQEFEFEGTVHLSGIDHQLLSPILEMKIHQEMNRLI